jgi:hypothetical protein
MGSVRGGFTRVNGPNSRCGRFIVFAASAMDSPFASRFRYSSALGLASFFFLSLRTWNSTACRIWANGGTPSGCRLSIRKM